MPQPPEPQGSCPRCGAVTQPLQQYCLECGTRLPQEPGLFAVFAHVESRFVPALVFLFVSAVATTAAVAAAPGGGGVPTVVATQSVTVGPGTRTTGAPATSTVPTTPSPTLTTGPLPTAPGSTGMTATSPATTVAPAPGGLVSWPAGKRGYTDV